MAGAVDSKQEVSVVDEGPATLTLPAEANGMRRRLRIGLAVAAVAACGMFTFGAIYAPRVVNGIQDSQEDMKALEEEWYNESYERLMTALWERWGPDDSIPSAAADFEFWTYSNRPSEVWFVIQLETTTRCTLRASDPCEGLMNEFAGIVLENYPRADELDRLYIIVSHVTNTGVVELSRSVDETRSITEWRRVLEAAKESTGLALPGRVERQL